MDGFDQTVNVKVIMATNRADTLDPALLRPGRLDRKIEFPLPDRRQKRLIFQVILGVHFVIVVLFYFILGQVSRCLVALCTPFSLCFMLDYILQVCTAKMNLGDEVDLEDYVSRPDKISAAEVS